MDAKHSPQNQLIVGAWLMGGHLLSLKCVSTPIYAHLRMHAFGGDDKPSPPPPKKKIADYHNRNHWNLFQAFTAVSDSPSA